MEVGEGKTLFQYFTDTSNIWVPGIHTSIVYHNLEGKRYTKCNLWLAGNAQHKFNRPPVYRPYHAETSEKSGPGWRVH